MGRVQNAYRQVLQLLCKAGDLSINGTPVTTGANISTVTDALGAPNRIDESAYGFDWYVYNSSYKDFIMIGVDADRICAISAWEM